MPDGTPANLYRFYREWGQDWDTRIPRADIDRIVGLQNVGMPDDRLQAMIRDYVCRLAPELHQACVDYALLCHRQNQRFRAAL
jgi:hypothetical protein